MNVTIAILITAGIGISQPISSFDEYTSRGNEAFARKEFREATEQFEMAKQSAAGDPEKIALASANIGSVEYTLGRVGAAVEQYRIAMRHLESLKWESRTLRSTLRNLATSLQNAWQNQEASKILDRLSELLKNDTKPDFETIYFVQLTRARIEAASGQVERAEKLYREVLNSPEVDSINRARAMDGLGDIELNLGRLSEAEALFTSALQYWQSVGNVTRVAASSNRLGDRWLNERNHRRAVPFLLQALAFYEEAGIGGSQLVSTLNNLGQAYRFAGKVKSSEEYFNKALIVALKDLGSEHPMVAAIELNIGDFKMSRKKYEDAEGHLERALAIHEKRFGNGHPEIANVVARLAVLHSLQKQYSVACRELGRALTIHEQSHSPATMQQAHWFEWRAELLRREENFAEAAKLEARAMKIRVKELIR